LPSSAHAAPAPIQPVRQRAEAALFRASAPEARYRAVSTASISISTIPQRISPLERSYRPLIVFTGRWITARTSSGPASPTMRLPSQRPTPLRDRRPQSPPAVLRLGAGGDSHLLGPGRPHLARPPPTSSSPPLRIARGIQNKVLEAMAMARPVSLPPPPSRGIDAKAGREIMVADTHGEQVGSILSLLANPKSAMAMGAAARRRMVARYRWDAVLEPLTRLLADGRRQAAE
jgi:hypothetical protein